MKYKNKTTQQKNALLRRIIKYYFNNPQGNIGMKEMVKKFKISETVIRKALSAELDRRFKNAQEVRNK